MSDIIQEVLFSKAGLDTDSAHTYMENGDAPYRLNILMGVEGSNGVIENAKGNRLATYVLNLSHTYQVVGSHYNQLTRKVYYLVYSAPYDWSGSGDYIYDNHLLEFNEDTEVITNIFTDERNFFGVDLRYPVKDWDMLGDKLYFNPRVSEPKMIDVTRALNYTTHEAWQSIAYLYGDKVRYFGGIFVANVVAGITAGHSPSTHPTEWTRIGDSYQSETDLNFDSEFRYAFNVIRHIPVYRPICSFGSDATKNTNNVRGKMFRFSYRYKYFDNTYSLFSAYSDVTLPQDDEYYNGEVPDIITTNNYINVLLQLHSASLIKEVDLVFQETGKDWKRAKIVNRIEQAMLDDQTITYKFYNTDAAYEVVNEDHFKEAFDSVPKRAATQELINKNIISYGGCTEGFDNIDKNEIKVSLTPAIVPLNIPAGIDVVLRDNVGDGDISEVYTEPDSWVTTIDLTASFGVVADGDEYALWLNGIRKTYRLVPADVVSIDSLAIGIDNFISANFAEGAVVDVTGHKVEIRGYGSFVVVSESRFYSVLANQTALSKHRGFKTGAWHPMCIFYYDEAMRRWDAQTSKENIDMGAYQIDGTTVYVPSFNEYSPTPLTTANKWIINWEVDHLPPEGAKWWRWGYAGNALCSYFVQYIVASIANEGSNWTKIDIEPLQLLKSRTTGNQFPQSIIDPYAWQKGDRVRFITNVSTATELGAVTEGVYDYEILKYDEETTPGQFLIYVQQFAHAAAGLGTESLIEIYRPLKTDTSRVFYEFGELKPIIEDSAGVLVHGSDSVGTTKDQDFALSQPATGTFSGGDIYHIVRAPSLPIDSTEGYFHESMWYSDFYDSRDYDRGRIGVETTFGERTLNIVRYSNQYLQNTGINGLSTFNADHYKELSDTFGSIVGMVEVGTTLKVYMEKKSASILIGRQEYMDANGKVTIATSDVVLGAIRYPENTFGTQWIESITKNNRYTYGFDIYNAVMWRDSANGIFPISGRYQEAGQTGDYKMQSWFREKSDALMLSGIENLKVLTVWDERYKNLYVIFKDHANNDNNETIVYHEPSDRWICFASFDQTPAEGWDEMLELDYWVTKGFENGIGYYFDEDTRFAVFNIPKTAISNTVYPDSLEIGFELFSPTVTATSDAVPVKIDLKLSLLAPTIIISNVDIAVSSMTWTALQYGLPNRQGTPFGCNPSPSVVTSIVAHPSIWFEMTDGTNTISVGGNAVGTPGSMLYFHPINVNDGDWGNRTAVITITGSYGDTDIISLVQSAPLIPATVDVRNAGDDTSGMILTNTSGQHTYGNRTISIALTANHPTYATGETFLVRWNVTITRGLDQFDAGIGNFWATDNTFMGAVPITLTMDAITGDVIYVWLKADTATNTDVVVPTREIRFTPYVPTVVTSACLSDVTNIPQFADTDDSYAEGETATITAGYNDNALYVTIVSKPIWITIWHGDDMTGYALYEGQTIQDQETITVFPSSSNTEYIGRSGVIALASPYGDTVNLSVSQAENGTLPVGQVPLPAGVATVHSSSSSYLTIIDNAYSVWGLSLSTEIGYSFKGVRNALYSLGETFDLYYRVDITRGGYTTTDSFGVIPSVANSEDSDNYNTFAGSVTLNSSTLENDIVTLYLSIYSF